MGAAWRTPTDQDPFSRGACLCMSAGGKEDADHWDARTVPLVSLCASLASAEPLRRISEQSGHSASIAPPRIPAAEPLEGRTQ